MLKRFRSFRVKLILYFTAVFGMIQIVLSLAGLALRERQIRDVYDQQLIERVAMVIDQMQIGAGPIDSGTLTTIVSRMPRSLYVRDYHVQIRDLDGQSLARTLSLENTDLPYTDAMKQNLLHDGIDVQMISAESLPTHMPAGNYRLLSQRLAGVNGRFIVVQIATSFEQVERSVASSKWLFYLGLPMGLAAAAATSWLVTGKLSYRINRVANLARELMPEDLSRRLTESTSDDEVADLVRNINRMLDRLEAGFRAQERFIHDASHELKTPIAALLAEAQVIKMTGGKPEEQQAFVDSAINELLHMSRLIESLLLLTPHKEQPVESFEECDINDLVVDAVRRCRSLAQEYDVAVLLTALDATEGCSQRQIRCNSELMVIMVSNLIRNAIRFTVRGGSVRVETRDDESNLVITVADEGPCISAEDLPHIFDRFYQGRDKSIRRGAGLGLTIASTIAKLHGGSIAAINAAPTGVNFTVSLPKLAV